MQTALAPDLRTHCACLQVQRGSPGWSSWLHFPGLRNVLLLALTYVLIAYTVGHAAGACQDDAARERLCLSHLLNALRVPNKGSLHVPDYCARKFPRCCEVLRGVSWWPCRGSCSGYS